MSQENFQTMIMQNFWWVKEVIVQVGNSPFPRYFKRKSDRETLAPERGYGK